MADWQAGKAAGAGGHRDAVERLEGEACLLDDPRDQRHQRFGVAALHRLRFLRQQLAGVGVENARSAGIQRGVDGKDQHGPMYSSFVGWAKALFAPCPPLTLQAIRICAACNPRWWARSALPTL